MACGDKYADLLVVRGHGPDEPCGSNLGLGEWACSALDAKAHNDRADEIMALNTQAWNALIEVGGHPSQDPALMEQVNAYWAAHEGMMRWSILGPVVDQGIDDAALLYNAQVVASAREVMRQGVCVLELLNGRYEAIKGEGSGIKPGPIPQPPPPEETPTGQLVEIVKWGVGGALVLGAGVLLVKLLK